MEDIIKKFVILAIGFVYGMIYGIYIYIKDKD